MLNTTEIKMTNTKTSKRKEDLIFNINVKKLTFHEIVFLITAFDCMPSRYLMNFEQKQIDKFIDRLNAEYERKLGL
jgi:hypothetical protein